MKPCMEREALSSNSPKQNSLLLMKKLLLLLTLPALTGFALVATSGLHANSGDSTLQILKFEADWCGPCQKMKPVFSRVSRNLSDHARFRSVNIDNQPRVAEAYDVQSVPTVIAIRDGRVVGRNVGYMNSTRLKAFVKRYQ